MKPAFQLKGEYTTPKTIKVMSKIKVISRFSRKYLTSRLNIRSISDSTSWQKSFDDVQKLKGGKMR